MKKGRNLFGGKYGVNKGKEKKRKGKRELTLKDISSLSRRLVSSAPALEGRKLRGKIEAEGREKKKKGKKERSRPGAVHLSSSLSLSVRRPKTEREERRIAEGGRNSQKKKRKKGEKEKRKEKHCS